MRDQEKDISFLDHLEIFRWHLIRSAVAILFFAVIAFIFKEIVFKRSKTEKHRKPHMVRFFVCAILAAAMAAEAGE